MKIEINVDETQFKEILDKELKDLPKEVLQGIIIESIKGYFQQDDYKNVETIFLREKRKSYDYGNHLEPNDLFTSIIENCNYTELQSLVDESIKTLKRDHYFILKDIIKDMIIKGLSQDYCFRSSLETAVGEILVRRSNNNVY